MPARLSRADKLLLGVYLPAYLVAVGLHAHEVARSGLAQLPVFVRGVSGEPPRVAGHPVETDSSGSGLEPGDRLLRLGDRDLAGVGYVGFQAIGLARSRPGQPAPLVFERAGVVRSVALEARPHPHPWSRLPLLLLIPAVSVLLIVRAPGSPSAQRLFLGAVTYGLTQAEFYGGPEWKTWLAAVVLNLAAPLAFFGMLRWARLFPDEMPEGTRTWAGWPWLGALLYLGVVRGSYMLGGPLPSSWIARVSFASHAAAFVGVLAILTWNYAHAHAAGRRRLRWILLGTLLGTLPLVATLLAPLVAPGWQGFPQAFAFGFLATVTCVSGLVLAVVRDNAFDVDRLLGATAAWSLAAGTVVFTLATLVPAAGTALAGSLGVEPIAVRITLAALLGALVVPLGARLRPRIDQLLFPGHEALHEGVERLLEDVTHSRADDELLGLAAERCARLLDARGFALYRAGPDGFRCVRAEGLSVPVRLPASTRPPLRLAPGNAPPELGSEAALVAPLRLDGPVDTLLCLGIKRSGDIYTRTDAAALETVAARVEATHARLAKEHVARESRAKTNLIAAAGHDLRQPLHAVGMLTEALAGRVSDAETRELVERIGASTQDLDEMLSSLLDRSKLDAGAVRAEREPVELRILFGQLARDFAGTAEAKGLRLRIVPTRITVESDRLLLLRIIRNLVSNAVRYTQTGSVLVCARPRGAEVAIEVRDSGPGIPEHARAEIFDAFHQLPGASRAGLGLGLSIVDGLAGVLGHSVSLRSAPGRGSTFAVRAMRAAPAAAPEPADPALAAAPALTARRVLVVDDDEAVRRATGELLRGWGCEVREAAGAEEALAMVASFAPDLVLADYQLGAGPTGPELVVRLRKAVGTVLAAVILTGDSEGPGLEASRAAGLAVLRKPVRPAHLRALLVPS